MKTFSLVQKGHASTDLTEINDNHDCRLTHRPKQPIYKINNTPADPKTVGALIPEL
jgi:hypothetical protein